MYDLAIIGGGAAGIACAKYASKAGLKTVLVEADQATFGGTCINSGCIPTKLFLNSSKHSKFWNDIFKEKEEVVAKIKTPLLLFLEKQDVDIIWGQASFIDRNNLSVSGNSIAAKNIIIATGSSPKSIIDHPKVIFAKDLFSQQTLPDKILIIGAGYIGMELACLFQNLGKSIRVIEKEKEILLSFERRLANRLKVILERKGIKVETEQDANQYNFNDFDLVVLAVGSIPNSKKLQIENIGLATKDGGWIATDSFMRTNIENIYACGDITGKKLLAYVAEYQAHLCIDNIIGQEAQEDYQGLPECVFSQPSMAQVGMLEDQAKDGGIKYKVVQSNFLRYSAPYVYNDSDGFIKIIVDENERIIGAGIISQSAAELISIFSLAIKNNLKLNDLKKCVFIHPSLSEIIPLLLNSV